jgi:uncharacterized membrane protein YdfJ with MMPL/SSD domain
LLRRGCGNTRIDIGHRIRATMRFACGSPHTFGIAVAVAVAVAVAAALEFIEPHRDEQP